MILTRLRHPVRGRLAALTIAVVVVLLVGGWVVVSRGAHGYYTISPGSAPSITSSSLCKVSGTASPVLPSGQPCARLVVPADRAHDLQGQLFMVDVLVGPTTPLQYIESKLGLLHRFHDGTILVHSKAILGSTPSSQLNCQDDQAMQASTSAAAVVALRTLGYTVGQTDLGVQLDQVEPGSAASAAGLRCNDLITAVNGTVVKTAEQFTAAVRSEKPGQTVKVTVSRVGARGASKTVVVSARLSGTPALGGQPAQPAKAFLGVVFETRTIYKYPFQVNINVGQIGGPSAGLALTLGLLDVLSNGQLTGGHRVAATGTISLNGTVGDVGGVAQKAVAVRKAGAQYFLVPVDELHDALSEAGSMKVFGVSNLQQALADLKSLGGHIPTLPGVRM